MGWKVCPDRYLKPGRCWIPRWRFRPFEDLEDAFQLLDRAADHFILTGDRNKVLTVDVQIRRRHYKASGVCRARTISTAVARALGLDVEERL